MASATSKTARASMPTTTAAKGSPEQLIASAPVRIVPLNSGKNVYFDDPVTGKTVHTSTSSEQFVELMRERVGQGMGPKLRDRLDELHGSFPAHGWDATLQRLEDAGVFA